MNPQNQVVANRSRRKVIAGIVIVAAIVIAGIIIVMAVMSQRSANAAASVSALTARAVVDVQFSSDNSKTNSVTVTG